VKYVIHLSLKLKLEEEGLMSVRPVKVNKLKIGITGNIASGKSTATTYLKAKGFTVIDSDAIVHTLWKDPLIIQALSSLFELDLNDLTIQQQFKQDVFNNEKIRKSLEAYLHPKVYDIIEHQIQASTNHVIIDIPLLFETQYENRLDAVILITVPKDIQKHRLLKRGLTSEQAESRISSQMAQSLKMKKTTHIISSTLNFEAFYQALEKEIDKIIHGNT
jgi:dephospho-CoA kinase